MRVLHLSSVYAPYSVGGAERVVATLAEECRNMGLTVGVTHLAPSPPLSVPGNINGVETWPLDHHNPLWIETAQNYSAPVRQLNKISTIFNILTSRDFGGVLDAFKPDVVHSHSMVELSPMAWGEVKRRGIPLIHTLHDYDLLCLRGALFKNGRKCEPRHLACRMASSFKRRYHKAIDHVVGISQAVLNRHLNDGMFVHLLPERRSVIWNPVSPPSEARLATTSSLAREITFGFIGRLVDEKGIGTLLDACRHLPHNGWRLKVAGRAPKGDEEIRARAAGLPVDFVGYVDPSAFLASIDLLVVPSLWDEPFGLTAIEAYQAGVPVLAARSGGLTEIVTPIGQDWLFEPGNHMELAAHMTRILSDGIDYSPVQSAIERLLPTFAPARVARQYIEVYEAVLGSGSRIMPDRSLKFDAQLRKGSP